MIDIIKVSFIFLFILFLLRKKISVGYALLAGSLIFLIFYSFNFKNLAATLLKSLTSNTSINLFFSLTLIKSFEYALRKTGLMQKMTEATQTLLNNRKLSILSMPLIIGMLPSLGGAYLSAPMVDSATKNLNMSKEEKAFINYWYRHPWELILPLYPGIVLASAVSDVPLRKLILLNLPVAVILFITGLFLSMRGVERDKKINKTVSYMGLMSFIPIVMVLLPVIFFKIDLYITLAANILILCIYYRKSLKETISIIRHGFTADVFVLVAGVIVFKEMLQLSGAVEGITQAITQSQIPYLVVFIALPMFIGVITGLSIGFVGSTFPLLIHLKQTLPYEISIAFVSGYIGVLLSPLHLCLILTRQYFNADMIGIYRKIVPGCLAIMITALIEFVILRYYS
ncbi:hypothetical protein TAGGR_1148 [Thermodesulfovibrio aggregans]|uniref:DUF401 family protein n=1 Tax=Thermodesulfovibrio aggregans TaxID=86166 RepID=A0A0U9HUE8_9BACT|nr:DUF401 family protein [Thermodesulfovibrio aggregans]GAQ93983.1 hypothetical protein TAGGR_1148 [Thermodesulfovibrio aggregans]